MITKFYNYLFYCYFKLFKLIKRRGKIDHLLASAFLAVILSLNILTVMMGTGILKIFYFKTGLAIPILGLFLFTYLFNQYYFIGSGRYKAIIKCYDEDPKIKKDNSIALAIIITFLSFFLFWFLGLLIDRAK
jgi:hypothetical protein